MLLTLPNKACNVSIRPHAPTSAVLCYTMCRSALNTIKFIVMNKFCLNYKVLQSKIKVFSPQLMAEDGEGGVVRGHPGTGGPGGQCPGGIALRTKQWCSGTDLCISGI